MSAVKCSHGACSRKTRNPSGMCWQHEGKSNGGGDEHQKMSGMAVPVSSAEGSEGTFTVSKELDAEIMPPEEDHRPVIIFKRGLNKLSDSIGWASSYGSVSPDGDYGEYDDISKAMRHAEIDPDENDVRMWKSEKQQIFMGNHHKHGADSPSAVVDEGQEIIYADVPAKEKSEPQDPQYRAGSLRFYRHSTAKGMRATTRSLKDQLDSGRVTDQKVSNSHGNGFGVNTISKSDGKYHLMNWRHGQGTSLYSSSRIDNVVREASETLGYEDEDLNIRDYDE